MAYIQTEKDVILRVAIDELRRVHEHVSNSYDQLRTKALAMVGGEVAITTFLFSGDVGNRIAMPDDTSGKIFLFAGIFALSGALLLLVSSIISGDWNIPGDMDEIEQIDNGSDNRYDSLEKFLLFLRQDYITGTRDCIAVVNKRAKRVNLSLYLLLLGVIILIVIKYGGQPA